MTAPSIISQDDFQFVSPERIEKFLNDLRITGKARFQSARRLEKLDRLSQWTINLMSLLLILIPTLTLSNAIKSDPYINSFSIFSAVFILFFSVSQSSEKYSLRAHMMHDCGRRLNKLRRKIASTDRDSITSSEFSSYLEKYDDILRDYPNHDQVDYLSAEYECNFKDKGIRKYFTVDYFRLTLARISTYAVFYATLIIFVVLPTIAYAIMHNGK